MSIQDNIKERYGARKFATYSMNNKFSIYSYMLTLPFFFSFGPLGHPGLLLRPTFTTPGIPVDATGLDDISFIKNNKGGRRGEEERSAKKVKGKGMENDLLLPTVLPACPPLRP